VAGGGVRARVVLRYGLLASSAQRGSLREGPAEVAGTTRGALAGWGELVEKRNFAELAGEFARDYFGKRHEWKDPVPSAVQT
jgi:hypothetical protein